MRFLCDGMLGRLARWLAFLGYDSRFAGASPRPDTELLEEAQREGRVFLTRDRGIPPVAGLRMVVLAEEELDAQLERLRGELGLRADPARLFTRCTRCNLELQELPREQALALVPPLVRSLDTPFRRCPGCARVYWLGTHVERTLARLRRLGL